MRTPRIGDWYTFCCEQDLKQIEDAEELDAVLDAIEDGPYPTGVWASKDDALRFIAKAWELYKATCP